jgi:uncharacterized ion transporter superfamily protein YfcC
MGCLAAARLDWAIWVRFVWKPMLGLIALIVHYTYVVDYGFYEAKLNFHRLGYWLLVFSVVFSMSSAWEYVRGFISGLDEVKSDLAGADGEA